MDGAKEESDRNDWCFTIVFVKFNLLQPCVHDARNRFEISNEERTNQSH